MIWFVSRSKLSFLAVLLLTLAGCGATAAPRIPHKPRAISVAQQVALREHLLTLLLHLPDARPDGRGNIEWLAPGETLNDLRVRAACSGEVIVRSSMTTYRGDPGVVLNSVGTAGIKVSGTDRYRTACMQEAARVLRG
jgi:hypothetical protein